MSLNDLSINILEQDGLYDLKEIRDILKAHHSSMSTHAMSDEALRLKGQKEAIGWVVEYFDRIIGE